MASRSAALAQREKRPRRETRVDDTDGVKEG